MIVFIVVVIILLCIIFGKKLLKDTPSINEENIVIEKVYESRWLFTNAEKEMYNKLFEIFKDSEYKIFAKVRLFDLIKPVDSKNYVARNKIQSKHVDFVITDNKLIAKLIIELDDSSHERKDRQQRDIFVDDVLAQGGYKVLHINKTNINSLSELINKNLL